MTAPQGSYCQAIHTATDRQMWDRKADKFDTIIRPFRIKTYLYKKAGVMLMALTDATSRQGTLFDDEAGDVRAAKLMGVVDALNRQHGRDTVQLGAAGIQARWAMRADNRTPKYTTSWDEVPNVWAK